MDAIFFILAVLATGAAAFWAAARLGILGLRRKRLAVQKSRLGVVVNFIVAAVLWAVWYVLADWFYLPDM